LPKIPVSADVEEGLSHAEASIDRLNAEVLACGLLTKVPADFSDRVRHMIRRLVDALEAGE
jgi:hypothetical protein